MMLIIWLWWWVLVLLCPVVRIDPVQCSTVLADHNARPIRVFLGENGNDCRPVYLPAVESSWIGQAVIAAEDKRFFQHHGVDWIAILRAIGQNIGHGRIVSGASTITTQVVKLHNQRPRNYWTKFVEALSASSLERRASKVEILNCYLNSAPFGGNLVGIEAASRYYFGRAAADLSLAEAAILAGLPKTPSRLRPDKHFRRALQRGHYILEQMLSGGMITADQLAVAKKQLIAIQRQPRPFMAPHFCQAVGAMLGAGDSAGTVVTTLDQQIQGLAEMTLARYHSGLGDKGVFGGAVVVLEVKSGAVRAMVGSPDFFDKKHDGQVNGAMARRSPGSALKPFVYALAVERGLCTSATIIGDEPCAFGHYLPRNYDETFNGPVTIREALVLSLNIPALKLARSVGPERLLTLLHQLGLNTLDKPAQHYGLGLVLGDGEVTLLDLVNAYACLARLGEYRPLRMLESSAGATEGVSRTLQPTVCYMIADMLSDEARGMDLCGHKAGVIMPKIAWKTGTSSGNRDAWTIAYNPEYVVGIWLGNPGGEAAYAGVGGVNAAPIAFEIFRGLYPGGDGPWFTRPTDLKRRWVCSNTGMCPINSCANLVEDDYIPGVSPNACCHTHESRMVAAQQVIRPAIISPLAGQKYALLDGERVFRQEIPLQAQMGPSAKEIYWYINGDFYRKCQRDEVVYWPLQRGSWDLACSDDEGHSVAVNIAVE